MTEYKTERVSPADEEAVLTIRSAFGWNFVNASEVYNETPKVTGVSARVRGGGGDGLVGSFINALNFKPGGPDIKANVQTTTDTTSYITLRFTRETTIPRYSRIKELESDYDACLNRLCVPKKPTFQIGLLVGYLVLMVMAAIGVFSSGDKPEPIDLLLIIPFFILVILVVAGSISYRRKFDRNDELLAEMDDYMREARNLLDYGQA